ncbi:hypothetical protein [Galbibacter mesophilus]|uniref:hypothetical protein n=1 Tax=Galbibacter mesophilus TaxID=379069 RepID=UPI00191DD9F2|nr:hypothetical protein [Galbibacter mesophilus]MCM5661641.1 hypothetical protein [Galbibacter mesophilus]
MAQDIKKLLKDCFEEKHELPQGHREAFSKLLEQELPQKKENKSFLFWKVAAAVLVLIGVGTVFFSNNKEITTSEKGVANTENSAPNSESITLGSISPDLKKVEDYYVANINLELAEIDLSEANKKLLDGYMTRLGELNDAYQDLTVELNEVGPNDQTINALISNLQLRLQLLYRLKEKIKELKQTTNEEFTTQNV